MAIKLAGNPLYSVTYKKFICSVRIMYLKKKNKYLPWQHVVHACSSFSTNYFPTFNIRNFFMCWSVREKQSYIWSISSWNTTVVRKNQVLFLHSPWNLQKGSKWVVISREMFIASLSSRILMEKHLTSD